MATPEEIAEAEGVIQRNPELKDAEVVRRLMDYHRSMLTELAKAFMVLNSAGVAAMLAFVQALVAQGGACPACQFKWFAVTALTVFLAGALLAGLSFGFRAYAPLTIFFPDNLKVNLSMLWSTSMFLSVLAFGIGSLAVVVGIVVVL